MTARHAIVIALATVLAIAIAGCTGGLSRIDEHALVRQPAPTGEAVQAAWLGTAGVLLDDGETAILIDPFVSRPALGRVVFARPIPVDEARIDAWMQLPGLERTAAVLVSHSHYDHVADAPSFARRTGALIVGSSSTAVVARAEGLPEDRIRTVTPGQPMRFGKFTVTMLGSEHGPALLGKVPYPGSIDAAFAVPARAKDYRMGGAFGIVVEHPAGTLVHHASASWVAGMYADVDADLVLLGLAGRKDTAEYLRSVVDETGARRVIPIHWDDFFRGFDRPLATLGAARVGEFFDAVADTRPDLRIETLPLGYPRTVVAR